MNSIVEVVEKQLESGKNCAQFTFLEDGENSQKIADLTEIYGDALKIAAHLTKDATALILLPQGISFIKAFFGCLAAQAVAVPLALPTKNRGLEKLQTVARDARVSFVLTQRGVYENLCRWFGKAVPDLRLKWLFVEEIEAEIAVKPRIYELPKAGQLAFLQYTSGSTGVPKAVMLTHENIVANSKIIQKCFRNTPESVSVCWLPSFHDMGLLDGIIQPIFSGFKSVLMSPTHFLQRPARWLRAMTEYGATYSGAPNFAFDFCAERVRDEELDAIDLRRLQCLYNGSEPIRQKTLEKFAERFSRVGFTAEKMFTCYGLAEATLAVTASNLNVAPRRLRLDETEFRRNSACETTGENYVEVVGCGIMHGDAEIIIVNPETLETCAENEIGEIWVTGKSIAAGYLNRAELTRETFVNRGGKRFLRTGDLGFLQRGELFVTGRMKDLIIIRGVNHYPQEIEQTVSESHAALEKNGCAVFPVEIENEEKLIVVQEIKRTALNKIDTGTKFSSIMAHLSQRHGLVPHDIVLISPNTLPKTTSGKIRRTECRKLWRENELKSLARLRD